MTETSSRYARKISGTTALQEALKEKQQHIEQLLAERDLERAEVAKATSHVGEIEQELALARDGHDQVKSGAGLVVMVTGPKLITLQRWCLELVLGVVLGALGMSLMGLFESYEPESQFASS